MMIGCEMIVQRETAMDHEPLAETLSDAGQLRRQDILRLAQREARRRRRRRSVARIVPAMLAIAIAAVLLHHPPRPAGIAATHQTPGSRLTVAASPVEMVQTDSTITHRLTLAPTPPRWTTLSDHDLLHELNNAGQPAGIVSINGQTFLMPRDPASR